MTNLKEYVITDSDGDMYVGEARVPMRSLVIAFHNGESAETIRTHYPALTLEEVYGGITYYLANDKAVTEYMKRQEAIWKEFKKKADENPPPVVLRLRAMR